MTRPVYVNGRALHRPPGGVRRYVEEVASHLDDAHIVAPPSARFPWSARVWEQTVLPHRTADGTLLNLAHSAPLRHARSVVVIHDLFAITHPASVRPSFSALMARQLPAIVERAQRVVAVSGATADQIAEHFDVDRSAIALAPPGVSAAFCAGDRTAARRELGLDPDRPVVSALLDAAPRKDAATTARVLADVAAAEPRAQIITAGRTRPGDFAVADPAVAAAAQSLDRHLDDADDDRLATMFQASDVMVSMSAIEGFGMPVIEALACGAQVVSRPVPSLLEFACGAAHLTTAAEASEQIIELLGSTSRSCAAAWQVPADLKWARTAATLRTITDEVGA